MKSALAMTRPTAASTSDRISAYCAFRSTSGICSASDTLKEALAVDARAAADPVSRLEHCVGADAAPVADYVVFPDHRAVAGVEVVTDGGAGVDDGAAPDHASAADGRRQLARPLPPR